MFLRRCLLWVTLSLQRGIGWMKSPSVSFYFSKFHRSFTNGIIFQENNIIIEVFVRPSHRKNLFRFVFPTVIKGNKPRGRSYWLLSIPISSKSTTASNPELEASPNLTYFVHVKIVVMKCIMMGWSSQRLSLWTKEGSDWFVFSARWIIISYFLTWLTIPKTLRTKFSHWAGFILLIDSVFSGLNIIISQLRLFLTILTICFSKSAFLNTEGRCHNKGARISFYKRKF